MTVMYAIEGKKGTEVYFSMSHEAWRTVMYFLERSGRYHKDEPVNAEVQGFINAVRSEMQHMPPAAQVCPVVAHPDNLDLI